MTFIKLYKWENEHWSNENFTANYLQNDREKATPYFLIPADKGEFTVYIETDGEYKVRAITDPNKGKWAGFVAFNADQDGWFAREYSGVKISNYQATRSFVVGHPDAEVNNCHFQGSRAVESDYYCSFDLSVAEDGAYWAMQAPPIQKSDDYNYVVSYGGYSDKDLEWGMLSISIDEKDEDGFSRHRRVRAPKAPRALEPAPHPGNLLDALAERKPQQTPLNNEGTFKLERNRSEKKLAPFDARSDPEPENILFRDLGGLRDNSSDEGESNNVSDWLNDTSTEIGQFDQIVETTPTWNPEPVARPPSPTITETLSSIPRTEQIMRMPGVSDPSDRPFVKSVLDQKHKKSFAQRLVPSLGGSRSSALQGGTLRQKHSDAIKNYMTGAEQIEANRIRAQQGKTAMMEYINSLNLHDRVQ